MSQETISLSQCMPFCFWLIGTSGGSTAVPVGEYGIAMGLLTSMTRDHDTSALQGYGWGSAYDFTFWWSLSYFILLFCCKTFV